MVNLFGIFASSIYRALFSYYSRLTPVFCILQDLWHRMSGKEKPSKKAVREKKKNIVEDLTFGLKNKNKSKKVW